MYSSTEVIRIGMMKNAHKNGNKNETLCTQMGISARCRMELSKSDESKVAGPSKLCYHSVFTQEVAKCVTHNTCLHVQNISKHACFMLNF